MPTLHITEYINAISGEPGLTSYTLEVGSDGEVSKPFSDQTSRVRLHVTGGDCTVAFGENPKATANDLPLANGSTEYFTVHANHRVAAVASMMEVSSMDSALGLMAVIADPKAAQASLDKIAKATEAADKVLAEIKAENAELRKLKGDLDGREAALDAREKAVVEAASGLAARETEYAKTVKAHAAAYADAMAKLDQRAAALTAQESELHTSKATFDNIFTTSQTSLADREKVIKDRETAVAVAELALTKREQSYATKLARLKEITA